MKDTRYATLSTIVEIVSTTDKVHLVKDMNNNKTFTIPVNDPNIQETGDIGSISINSFSSGKLDINMTNNTTIQALLYSLIALLRKSAEELKVTPEEIIEYIKQTNTQTTDTNPAL